MSQSYLKGMDGLRAIGVILVLIAHLWPRPGTMLDYFHFGRVGVILFFAISGFLVVRSLLDLRSKVENNSGSHWRMLSVFGFRRALRIFPLYYLALFFLYCSSTDPAFIAKLPWLIFYGSNYGPMFDVGFDSADHFWTLAIEEQFYFIVPFLVVFFTRQRSSALIIGMLFAGVLIKVVSAYWLASHGVQGLWNKVTHPLWGCVEGLCLGALLAYKPSLGTRFGSKCWMSLGIALTFSASVYRYFNFSDINQDPFYASFSHICFALLSLSLIAHVIAFQSGLLVSILEWPAFRWLGRVSYGVYVIHYIARPYSSSLFFHYQNIFPSILQLYLLFFGVGVFSIALASVSYIFFERPLLSLKRFYLENRVGRLTVKAS
jgi:peptidoglycan/LPS O-acetylase OafA/YrhL